MEIFWTGDISDGLCRLSEEESGHCVRVLRHRVGDHLCIIDGRGTMYDCSLISDSPKGAVAKIDSTTANWGGHPYNLTMAVCPTKNIDRYEWFAEKATEFGIDRIVPVIGEHSERRIVKNERLGRILLSATKQSLKASIPELLDTQSVKEFIESTAETDALKLIGWCFEGIEKRCSIRTALEGYQGRDVIVLIGPEGDFSKEEAEAAVKAGYIPVQIGDSRLRTETAALAAVSMTYYKYL